MKIIILIILVSSSWCRLSGFESNMEKVKSSMELIMEKMKSSISPLMPYIKNLDKFFKNEMLFSEEFLEDLNQLLAYFEDEKSFIFRNLKLAVTNIFYVHVREKSFDLYLQEDYSNLIQFLANLDLEENLEELFKDFVGQKNMVFYDISEIHSNVVDSCKLVINIFHIFEQFRFEAKLPEDKTRGLTMHDLERFYYILGVISDLKNQQEILEEMEEELEKNFRNYSNSLASFDDALDTLKIYYHKRYIQGIIHESSDSHEEVSSGSSEESLEVKHLNDEAAKEDERDPINLCDTIFMDNYDVEGLSEAFELDRFDQIRQCPNIKNSCCSKDEINRVIHQFSFTVIPTVQKQYKALYDMVTFILDNYSSFNKHAYKIYRLKEKDPVCELSSKNIIFTPLSIDFVKKFKVYMQEAILFSLNSRNGMFCAICDFDFNKNMIEEGTIKLSADFCNKMVKNTFNYTSAYHLQLIDYFNNLIKLVQCDPNQGEIRIETDIKFEENKDIIELLVKCDEKDRENCIEYCSNYFFTKFTSIFDIDFELVYEFFKFITSKVTTLKIPTQDDFNHESLRIIFADNNIEKNTKGFQSIDNLKRVIIEDEEDTTANNPFLDGDEIKSNDFLFD